MADNKRIQREAMLVDFTMGSWNPTRFDNNATHDLLERTGATRKSARVRKTLVATERLRPIRTCNNKLRGIHAMLTIPWDSEGMRLLPVKHYERYRTMMDEWIEKRREAVALFLDSYNDHVEEARDVLGTLFNPADYEDVGSVRARYYAEYTFAPVPDGSHFVADIGEEEAARIRKSVERQVEARVTAAVTSLYGRIGEAVSAFASHIAPDKNVADDKVRMYDSMLQKLRDVVDAVPTLNLTNDPVLTKLTTDIGKALDGLDMDQFRPKSKSYDPALRQKVTTDMQKISERLAGFLPAPAAA